MTPEEQEYLDAEYDRRKDDEALAQYEKERGQYYPCEWCNKPMPAPNMYCSDQCRSEAEASRKPVTRAELQAAFTALSRELVTFGPVIAELKKKVDDHCAIGEHCPHTGR